MCTAVRARLSERERSYCKRLLSARWHEFGWAVYSLLLTGHEFGSDRRTNIFLPREEPFVLRRRFPALSMPSVDVHHTAGDLRLRWPADVRMLARLARNGIEPDDSEFT
jgi:hypothetical protein